MAKAATPAELGVAVGQVFLDKYRVDAILGHGGMGVVCACTHLGLNERFAMKMLRLDVLADVDAVERFQREARAASKLKSEYVARVIDVGQLENGVPYMMMEYLDGLDLGQLLEERGVLQAPWASELMLQTCEALAEAHSLGIVHRDVKPTNLFVTWRPDNTAIVKVLDFGISKSAAGTDMHLTQTQSVLGTPAYMSPEQMRSARLVDSRSDIWSLGSVFYELLEGRRPFEADSFSEMCVKVAVDPPTPMVNTPAPLQQVILRCLEKAPEHRYPNMATLAADLVPYVPDPHSGQVLVDRMSRMLRRSHGTWDGDSTSSGPRIQPIADIKSGPVRAHSPPVAAWVSKSDPAAMTFTPRPGSLQVQTPLAIPASPTTTIRTRSGPNWVLIISLFVALGLAGGLVALAVTNGSDDDKPVAERHETAPAPTANPQPAVAPTPTPPAPQQTAVQSTKTEPATGPGEPTIDPATHDEAKTEPTKPPPAKQPPKVAKSPAAKAPLKASTTGKTPQHEQPKHEAKPDPSAKLEPLPPSEPPKNLKCGLYDLPHDYDRSCSCPNIAQNRCGGLVNGSKPPV